MAGIGVQLRSVMLSHSILCIALGIFAVFLPHKLSSPFLAYNHMAHEFIRLYGCITLSVGWFVWSTQKIKDGRLVRAISETFAMCYLLQSIVLIRAQLTNPEGHSVLHWFIFLLFFIIGSLYGAVRFTSKPKDFELPGGLQDE